MSKAPRGDRSFQPGAGKGDASRISDAQTFRDNYDQIDWGPRRLKRAMPVLCGWDEGEGEGDQSVTDDAYRRGDWEDSLPLG